MNILKAISKLNELAEQLKKLENNESFRRKLEEGGVKGRIEIEDFEVLFLVRRRR